MNLSLPFALLLMLAGSTVAEAYPEFAGDGYFSCTSCHVSTSGGDVVTAYGRSFAEEKLAWNAYAGEAMPLHSSKATPEWLLLAGHARWIQIHYEDSKSKEGRFFNMQRSLDFGFQVAGFYSYLTLTQEREQTYNYKSNSLLLDRFLLRYDFFESLSLRYGLLSPKYGLNIADHNAFVRSKSGLGAGSEEGLTELSWFSEYFEVNGSHSATVPSNDRYLSPEKSEQRQNSYVNVSAFLLEKHRLSLSGLHRYSKERQQTGGSFSTVISPGSSLRYAFEANTIQNKSTGSKAVTNSLYSQLTLWIIKGFYPGLRYEQVSEVGDQSLSRADKIALNFSIHPRPHFEVSGSIGLRRDLEAFNFGHTGFIMFHYWL